MVWTIWDIFTEKWLQRAEEDRTIDDGDRFISLWIAFNGWMRGKFPKAKNEGTQIESVKSMQDFKEVFNRLKLDNPDFNECLYKMELRTLTKTKEILN